MLNYRVFSPNQNANAAAYETDVVTLISRVGIPGTPYLIHCHATEHDSEDIMPIYH